MHGANLLLRFLLEIAALAGFATWAWSFAAGFWRWLAAVAVIVLLGAVWTTFAVPDDPSRSGNAPVPVSGAVRLVLELLILFGGALAFHLAGHTLAAAILAALIAVHYALSRQRILWLLER